jgi:hypothetical protein
MTSLQQVTAVQKTMIEEFQCPGCMHGHNIECVELDSSDGNFCCKKHYPATTIMPFVGPINLGLPKGFNRIGPVDKSLSKPLIRLWPEKSHFKYDKFNIAAWAMEKDGYLFVRCYMPRLNWTFVDVIQNGTIKEICPDAVDVGKFIDEID